MKGDLIYTNEYIKVIIKRANAYCYLFDTFIGKVEVNEKLFSYLKMAGFKQQESENMGQCDNCERGVVIMLHDGQCLCRDCYDHREIEITQSLELPE